MKEQKYDWPVITRQFVEVLARQGTYLQGELGTRLPAVADPKTAQTIPSPRLPKSARVHHSNQPHNTSKTQENRQSSILSAAQHADSKHALRNDTFDEARTRWSCP